jgi:hypothetical protein
MTWRASMAPLREVNFRWYFLSRFVNTLGNMMASVALAFAVLDITDSATALGQVLAAHTIPTVLLLLGCFACASSGRCCSACWALRQLEYPWCCSGRLQICY